MLVISVALFALLGIYIMGNLFVCGMLPREDITPKLSVQKVVEVKYRDDGWTDVFLTNGGFMVKGKYIIEIGSCVAVDERYAHDTRYEIVKCEVGNENK